MLTKEQYIKEYGCAEIEKTSYFVAFIADYLNENLKQLGDIEERKNWIGLDQDIYADDTVAQYDTFSKHVYCTIDMFSNMEGYVSDQIPLIREKLYMLQQVLAKLKLDKCIKLKIDFEDWSKKPTKNEEYDPINYPYKYFCCKNPVVNMDINLNIIPKDLLGYLVMNNVDLPEKDFELYE